MTAKKADPDLALYESLLGRRARTAAALDPSPGERAEKIRAIGDALLAGEEPPKVYVSRSEQLLELDGVNHAIGRLVRQVGEGIAKQRGRDYDSINVQIDPATSVPESGEALVALFENACELADRRDAATAKQTGQQQRFRAALEAYNNAKFARERNGEEPAVASEGALKDIDDPGGLWAVEGQPGVPQLRGHEMGLAATN